MLHGFEEGLFYSEPKKSVGRGGGGRNSPTRKVCTSHINLERNGYRWTWKLQVTKVEYI